MIVVTSWDDGHPLDERVAEMLKKYALKGTFYVPARNSEGYSVLSPFALSQLAMEFEIGGHTLDHVHLTSLKIEEANRQIREGKDCIEQQTGHEIQGFCYPGGHMNQPIRELVRANGFRYARTIENLRIDCSGNDFLMPTTLQFFPHTKVILCRNYFGYRHWAQRLDVLRMTLGAKNWWDRFAKISDAIAETDNILHIWGHSWEIEKNGLWDKLNLVLSRIASHQPRSLTVMEAFAVSRIGGGR